MFWSRLLNNVIDKVHGKTLSVILGDQLSDIYSHHENIQSLMIKMFKIKNELAPAIMVSMFQRRNEYYNLRNFQAFLTEKKRTMHYGLETLSFWSPRLWALLTENIKEVESLKTFKKNLDLWRLSMQIM